MNSERSSKFVFISAYIYFAVFISIQECKIAKLKEEIKWWKCQPPYAQPDAPKEVE